MNCLQLFIVMSHLSQSAPLLDKIPLPNNPDEQSVFHLLYAGSEPISFYLKAQCSPHFERIGSCFPPFPMDFLSRLIIELHLRWGHQGLADAI